MSPGELLDRIAARNAPTVLDVRAPHEFAGGHVPGAVNIPFNRVSRRLGELDADRAKPIVVYCGHGPRAWLAARALRRAGFTRIDYLAGHMAAWRRSGLPEER